MWFPPPEVVETWPAPNYVDPTIRRYYTILVNVIQIIIATIMVALRFFTRFIHARNGQLDDWLIVVALPRAIALAVEMGVLSGHYGFNKHIWDFDPVINNKNLVTQRKVEWIAEMLYLWSSSLRKTLPPLVLPPNLHSSTNASDPPVLHLLRPRLFHHILPRAPPRVSTSAFLTGPPWGFPNPTVLVRMKVFCLFRGSVTSSSTPRS